MKYLLIIALSFIIGLYAGEIIKGATRHQQNIGQAKAVSVKATLDTIPEHMHVSTRARGFVTSQVALSVRRNGYCVAHLQCNGKPFKAPYYVGWCEGKERLLNSLIEILNNKQ